VNPRRRDQVVSVVAPLVLLLLWEILVRIRVLDPRFFPAPSEVRGAFWSLLRTGDLWRHVGISLWRIF
jgi:ABC-type nitrate/sulfonate/bicarbonate transport system permease component